MLEQILKEHADEISSLLSHKYGLSSQQASPVASAIFKAVPAFLSKQAASSNLDLDQVLDLFNKNTPNPANTLFSGLSATIAKVLTNLGLTTDQVSKISTQGLDDILKIIQQGKIGSLDLSAISSVVKSISGPGTSGGLDDLSAGLKNIFGPG